MWFSLAGVDEHLAYAAEKMNPGEILEAGQMTEKWITLARKFFR
jgi:hypothetical protein